MNKIHLLWITVLLAVCFAPMVMGTEYFKYLANATVSMPLYENDISPCTTCNAKITIDFPRGTGNYVRDKTMTITGNDAIYNIPAGDLNTTGEYAYTVEFDNGVDYGAFEGSFMVTKDGEPLESNKVGIIGLGLFAILLVVLGTWLIMKNRREESEYV